MNHAASALRDAVVAFGVGRALLVRAEQIQAVHGGSLDTALLEAGADPSLVTQALERATGLRAATEDELGGRSDARVEIAQAMRWRLVPLAEQPEALVVAASVGSARVAAELLGVPVQVRVVPEWRLELELARRYGRLLPERFAVLAARLIGPKSARAAVERPRAAGTSRVPRAATRPADRPQPPTATGLDAPAAVPAPTPPITPAMTPEAPADEAPGGRFPSAELPIVTAEILVAPVATDYAGLVAELESGELAAAQAHGLEQLVRAGRDAVPVLMSGFPGKLVLNRRHPPDARRPVADHGPRLRALVHLVRDAVPELVSTSEQGPSDSRWYALALLGELPDARSIAAAGDRLFDDDEGLRALAIETLQRMQGHGDLEGDLRALEARLRAALGAVSGGGAGNAVRRRRAAEALGALRAEGAIGDLILHVASLDPDLSTAVRRALYTITRQDFGEKEKRWRSWWDDNGSRHRVEWLLDALSADADETRLLASEELKRLTGEWFGYQFDLPKREREAALKRWRSWWGDVGRRRFVR